MRYIRRCWRGIYENFSAYEVDSAVKKAMKETKQKDIDIEKIISQFESVPYLVPYDCKDDDIIKFIKANANEGQNILDVGGGNGNFLDNVFRYTPIKRLYNLEITSKYAKYQCNKNIIFINGTVTNLPFKDDTFDFVISKSVLHHLIGSSRKKSKENAHIAVSEMMRVVNDGGYIYIDEMYNKYAFFSGIVFYMLRFLSKIRMTSKYFGINKDVVICPLTPSEIKDLLINNKYSVELEYEECTRFFKALRWKITILMSNAGSIYLIGKINKR